MALTITDQAHTILFTLDNGAEYNIDKDLINVKISWGKVIVYGSDEESKPSQKIKFNYKEVTSPVFISNNDAASTILGYKNSAGVTIGDVQIIDGANQMTVNPDGSINVNTSGAPNPDVEIGNVGIVDEDGNRAKVETNGSIPVTIQDQHTPVVIVPFTLLEQATSLNTASVYGERTILVNDSAGIVPGKWVTIFSPNDVRYTMFMVIDTAANVITLDSPLDFAYPTGSYVDVGDHNLAVDGSGTPVVFGIRNNAGQTPPPGIELTMDVTRIMFTCKTDGAVDLSKFADIAGGIERGLLLRKRDGETFNIFNVKTNAGLAGLMYDWSVQSSSNPNQGQNGFLGRLTFAGQSKMGVVIRLPIGEDLEMVVQDDLTGIDELGIIAEGSIVAP